MGDQFVLTVVIIELAFVFGIGITCILFSLNLVKSLREADHVVASGLYPPPLSPKQSRDGDTTTLSNNNNPQQYPRNSDLKDNLLLEDSYNIMGGFSGGGGDVVRSMVDMSSPHGPRTGSGQPAASRQTSSFLDVDENTPPTTFLSVIKTFTVYVKFW